MGLGNPRHQSHSERDDVFFAIGKSIWGTRQCTFQQPLITKKVRLARYRDKPLINLDGNLGRQPYRLTWQVQPEFLETAQ